jgi:hypothetical protein
MQAYSVASRPACGSMLDEVAALAGDEHAKAETGQVVIRGSAASTIRFVSLGMRNLPLQTSPSRKHHVSS